MIDGRWLNSADIEAPHAIGRCSAPASPSSTAYLRGETRTITLERHELRRGRRARHGRARSRSRQRGVHHAVGGEARLRDRRQAEPALRPRRRPGTTQETADAIPTAINLGGPDQVSTKVPSDVLQAASQADKTLAADRAVRGPARAGGRRARHRERHVDLGDPTIVGDRHPARGRPQPVEDRLAVPARVAVRRHPRRDPRRRARGRRRVSRVRVRGLGRRDRLPQDPDLDGPRAARVGRSRACTRRSRPRRLEPLETLRLG